MRCQNQVFPPFSIILASSSPYRKAQLEQQLSIPVSCIPPAINEEAIKGETAQQTALRLSIEKAKKVGESLNPGYVVIGGDQTAQFNGRLLRKPCTREVAIEQLTCFSGHTLKFYSGICLFKSGFGECLQNVIVTEVHFRALERAQIENYVDLDKPYDCVGSFKYESVGISLFDSITSADPSALNGLPLISLNKMLLTMGIDILSYSQKKNTEPNISP